MTVLGSASAGTAAPRFCRKLRSGLSLPVRLRPLGRVCGADGPTEVPCSGKTGKRIIALGPVGRQVTISASSFYAGRRVSPAGVFGNGAFHLSFGPVSGGIVSSLFCGLRAGRSYAPYSAISRSTRAGMPSAERIGMDSTGLRMPDRSGRPGSTTQTGTSGRRYRTSEAAG